MAIQYTRGELFEDLFKNTLEPTYGVELLGYSGEVQDGRNDTKRIAVPWENVDAVTAILLGGPTGPNSVQLPCEIEFTTNREGTTPIPVATELNAKPVIVATDVAFAPHDDLTDDQTQQTLSAKIGGLPNLAELDIIFQTAPWRLVENIAWVGSGASASTIAPIAETFTAGARFLEIPAEENGTTKLFKQVYDAEGNLQDIPLDRGITKLFPNAIYEITRYYIPEQELTEHPMFQLIGSVNSYTVVSERFGGVFFYEELMMEPPILEQMHGPRGVYYNITFPLVFQPSSVATRRITKRSSKQTAGDDAVSGLPGGRDIPQTEDPGGWNLVFDSTVEQPVPVVKQDGTVFRTYQKGDWSNWIPYIL